MSYSRCLSLSALLASTFITPVTAMDLTPVSSDNNAILEYTHAYTPVPEPASSFADMSRSYQTAGICFLGVGDCDPNVGFASSGSSSGGNDDYTVDTSNQCLNEGFSKQNCNSVQTIDGVCPYNSAYGLGCKCVSNLVSCPAGQVGVGESCDGQYASCQCDPALVACSAKENGTGAECGGRYESCVCKDMYLYNSSNCSYPRSVSGDSCGGKYTDCVCPAGVDEGPYGCAEYYPSPCSSVCKAAYSDNCHIRSDDPNIALGYGCMKEWDDCSSKCERAYTDMCRERTAVSTPYGCESYYSDCSSKCQTAYADNCRNQTAAISSCPSNASCSYYSDCSSKISSWSCNSGYKQEGSSCVVADPCASYYKCDGTYQYCAGTTCPQDSSKCNVYCPDNMYPYRCFDNSFCNGKYHRNGYCSEPCPTCTRLTDYSIEEELDWGGEYQTDGYCYFLFSNGRKVDYYTGVRWTSGSSDGNFRDECNRICDEYK